jgi:hypothetical protein
MTWKTDFVGKDVHIGGTPMNAVFRKYEYED